MFSGQPGSYGLLMLDLWIEDDAIACGLLVFIERFAINDITGLAQLAHVICNAAFGNSDVLSYSQMTNERAAHLVAVGAERSEDQER